MLGVESFFLVSDKASKIYLAEASKLQSVGVAVVF